MLRPAGLATKASGNMIHIMTAAPQGITMPPAVEEGARAADARMAAAPAPSPVVTASVEKQPISLTTPPGDLSTVRYLTPPAGAEASSGASAPMPSQAQPLQKAAPFSLFKNDAPLTDGWVAEKGETLRGALKKWADRAGVDLSWQAEYDFPLQASVSLTGTFEEAARLLLIGFQNAEPQPYGSLHKSQAADQRVLVIKTRGNKNTD
jgi:hypothetical protein